MGSERGRKSTKPKGSREKKENGAAFLRQHSLGAGCVRGKKTRAQRQRLERSRRPLHEVNDKNRANGGSHKQDSGFPGCAPGMPMVRARSGSHLFAFRRSVRPDLVTGPCHQPLREYPKMSQIRLLVSINSRTCFKTIPPSLDAPSRKITSRKNQIQLWTDRLEINRSEPRRNIGRAAMPESAIAMPMTGHSDTPHDHGNDQDQRQHRGSKILTQWRNRKIKSDITMRCANNERSGRARGRTISDEDEEHHDTTGPVLVSGHARARCRPFQASNKSSCPRRSTAREQTNTR